MKDLFGERKIANETKEVVGVFQKEIVTNIEINSVETAIVNLEAKGYKIDDYVKAMLNEVDWNEKLKYSYNIVSVFVREIFGDKDEGENFFGFKKKYTYGDILIEAQKNGFDLIPPALAPEIRLNYDRNGQKTTIAMNAMHGRYGLAIFTCGSGDSGSWLSYSSGDYFDKWEGGERFFFIRK